MRFGLFTLLEQPPGLEIDRCLREALEYFTYGEELGFEDAWVAEHHFHPYGTAGNPATFLCALAARTKRMRLAPAVSILPMHHPLQIAEDYAMVDVLSDGRLDFGVGRGYQPSELAGFGIPMSETRDRFDEALEIIDLAWTGEEFSYQGRWYQVDNLRTYPRPVQRPAPLTLIASISPETFGLVREKPRRYGIAASLLTSGYPTVRDGLNDFVGSLPPGDDRRVSLALPAYIAETDAEAIETVTRYYGWYFETVKHLLPGGLGEEVDESYASYPKIAEMAANADIAKFARLFPIGSPESAIERLLALVEAIPANQFVFWMNFGGLPPRLMRASMERMAELVLPAVSRELERKVAKEPIGAQV